MKKVTKRGRLIQEKVDRNRTYEISEALGILKGLKATKFDETVEVALRLGVDPRKADQMVRGTCSLPNGLGKEVRVLVFAKGEKVKEAQDAGADFVGGEEMAQQIQEGWTDFDRVVATPDMMAVVGKIGKILGPRGLMPNPKVGTVTFEVGSVVQSIKAGQVEFRVDKAGNMHAPVGRLSFEVEKLQENISAFVDAVSRLKPSTSKGIYLRNCSISSTMGPGLRVDLQTVR
jgi:large subunit ribosomal protein L1